MHKSLHGIYNPWHKVCLLLLDVSFIAIAFLAAYKLRLQQYPDYATTEYIGITAIIILGLFIGDGYTSSRSNNKPKLPLRTFFIVLATTIPCTLFIYILGPERFSNLFGRGIFPVAIVLAGIFSVANRVIGNHLFHRAATHKNVLLLGKQQNETKDENSLETALSDFDFKYQYSLSIEKNIKDIDLIVICPSYKPIEAEQQKLVELRLSGVPVFSLSDFYENYLFLIPVHEIDKDWFIRAEGFTMLHSSITARVKRCVDIFAAIALLIVTIPICAISAALIKFSSRGPIFFSQVRVGTNGRNFVLYKFRTMHAEAETEGAQWAAANDPRVIPFGKFLRQTRIDELPQCWNILRGDMSIVGPRPERPEFTSSLIKDIPYFDLRHLVKPGLTGWAQVSYPYGASVDDARKKLQYDLYYIKNQSLVLDLNILLRTTLVTLKRSGR